MRPVIIAGPLPSAAAGAIGGVATHTQRLAGELKLAGRRVCVLDDSHPNGAAPDMAWGVRGASPTRVGTLASRHPMLALSASARAITAPERAQLGIPITTAMVRPFLLAAGASGLKGAILHVQQADFRPLYADWAGIPGPRIIVVHGLGLLETTSKPALESVMRANLSAATVVVTPSRALASEVVALGIRAERVQVIPNGVDHDVFHPRPREQSRAELGLDGTAPLVVYVGRLTAHKGVTDLLEAWQRIRSSLPEARLALVGPANEPLATDVPGLLTIGAVDVIKAAQWLGAADVVAVPSRYEGFGLSALEAMASARPVVATNVGGLTEVVPPDAGILVPARDADALAAALSRFLNDPDLARSVGAEGARVAKGYSWEATARSYGVLYDSV